MENSSQANGQNARRKRNLLTLTAVFAAAGLAYGIHWYLFQRNYVETDNAYVQGNVVLVTPQVGGTVLGIRADDTDFVEAGQTLVALDPADARVALEQAEAQLAQTVREVRTTFANNSILKANIAVREADVRRVAADVAKAEEDVSRRRPLVASGAVGKEELEHAQTTLANARAAAAAANAALTAAQEQLSSNLALTDGTQVENHPNVERAAAKLREAYLAFKRTDILAPVAGHVAKRGVQVGERVQAGAPMMAIIPLDQLWVDANFKESQLRDMRIGQPVKLYADIYGKSVEYTGTLVGLAAGTGAAFSLLPAQNATGNWIKVVQRVPVRVALDARQVAEHPLRIGLSMLAEVDIHDQSGKALADAPRQEAPAQRAQPDAIAEESDALIRRIVAENLDSKLAGQSGLHGGKQG